MFEHSALHYSRGRPRKRLAAATSLFESREIFDYELLKAAGGHREIAFLEPGQTDDAPAHRFFDMQWHNGLLCKAFREQGARKGHTQAGCYQPAHGRRFVSLKGNVGHKPGALADLVHQVA